MDGIFGGYLRQGLLASAAIVCVASAEPAIAQTRTFNVTEQDAASGVAAFARQADIQLLISARDARGRRTNAVRGDFTVADGLQQLLANSGLRAQATGAQTYSVVPVSGETGAGGVAADSESAEEQDIVVTGTNIRGQGPVGSPLTTITGTEIRESGYGRVQDYLETLSSNFTGSATEGYNAGSDTLAVNNTRGQAIDLRGLGSGSTLVLVNGRRQPGGGLEGAFVDISSISASAVERVEVLTDGASALYGTDAVGGVVNFILRRDFDGFENSLRVAATDQLGDEIQASMLAGRNWNRGNILVGYQFSQRDALMRSERPYGRLNLDYRSLGGSDFRDPAGFGIPGTIRRSGLPNYGIPRGPNATRLTVAQLLPGVVNFRDLVTNISEVPEQTLHTVFVSVRQELSDVLELWLEGRYGHREMQLDFQGESATLSVPSTNPFYVNPYGGTANVQVTLDLASIFGLTTQLSTTNTYSVAAGARYDFAQGWRLNFSVNYGREESHWQRLNLSDFARRTACLSGVATPQQCPGAPLNVFGDGTANDPVTVEFIRYRDNTTGAATIKQVTAIADGPLFNLPAGPVRLALGADYREESVSTSGTRTSVATGIVIRDPAIGDQSRHVSAVFGEMVVPVIGRESDARPILELSFAGRLEDYSDFGSTFNPRIGMRFAPLSGLALRGSWGTSFRAPRFGEIRPTLFSNSSGAISGIPDPRSPTGTTTALVLQGFVPDLQPETAEVWTIGFDVRPVAIPGLSLSATLFDVDYRNKIAVGGAGFNTLIFEDQWGAVITRNPTAGQVQEICNRPDFSPSGGNCPFAVLPGAIIDARLQNLAALHVRGIDLDARYQTDTSIGLISIGLRGTRNLNYDRRVSETAPETDVLNTVGNLPALRLRGSLSWRLQGWSANFAANYLGGFEPVANLDVESWTTVDASLGYEFQESSPFHGLRLQLAVTNLADQRPPFVNIAQGYDFANANDIGRSISFTITKRW